MVGWLCYLKQALNIVVAEAHDGGCSLHGGWEAETGKERQEQDTLPSDPLPPTSLQLPQLHHLPTV